MKSFIEKGGRTGSGLFKILLVAFAIILFFLLYRLESVVATVNIIVNILKPFIYGLVMAYLLCPLYNLVFRKLSGTGENIKKSKAGMVFAKVTATAVSLIVMFAIIAGLLWMVIPGLIDSIAGSPPLP